MAKKKEQKPAAPSAATTKLQEEGEQRAHERGPLPHQTKLAGGKPPSKAFTGMLACGLVNVPIVMYTGARELKIDFHTYHKGKDGKPCDGSMKQLGNFCAKCQGINPKADKAASLLDRKKAYGDVSVPEEEVYRGFEYGDRIIEVTDAEIDALKPESAKVVTILEMVPEDQVDPIFFESSFYLGPDTSAGGQRGFSIVRAAMVEDRQVAIAKFVKGKREMLLVVRPYEDRGMIAHTAYMSDEIKRLDFPELVETDPREIKAARQLFSLMRSDWDPSKYKDGYRESVIELIAAKAAKKPGPTIMRKPAASASVDFMSAFEQTLSLVQKGELKPGGKKKAS